MFHKHFFFIITHLNHGDTRLRVNLQCHNKHATSIYITVAVVYVVSVGKH